MSDDPKNLIPAPPVLREKLARNIREQRLLRDLLRISVRTAEEERELARITPRADDGGKAVPR